MQDRSHDDDDEGLDDEEFANELAGSYWYEALIFDDGDVFPEEGLPLQGLKTYHADGTTTSTDSGSYNPAAGLQSVFHGSWDRTGPLELADTQLIFLFEGVEQLQGLPPGTHTLTARPQFSLAFTPDFEVAEGCFSTDAWLVDQDPVTDPPLLVRAAYGVVTMRKIHPDPDLRPVCD